jgi:hypothetical protein
MKGVRNTSFFHAESRKKKKKPKQYVYMKSSVTGTIFKITRRNIKANVNGDDDERQAFRFNERYGMDQENTLWLRAETPTSFSLFEEDTKILFNCSKEEYISKYYNIKGKKIKVGDSIKFKYLDIVSKEITNEVKGTVKELSQFQFTLEKFTLENHRMYEDFMYDDCTEIKVKHNGFFVDGYFKPVLIK